MNWFVYILQCKDGSLYTGITNDVNRRLAEHQMGVGCKYTRGRRPVTLMGCQEVGSRSEALSLECQIKKLSRKRKICEVQKWAESQNHTL